MLYVRQFRLMVRESLQAVGLWDLAAENLLVGTALQESNLYFLKQVNGPAIGFFQIEPETYAWIRQKIKDHGLCWNILKQCGFMTLPEDPGCLGWHIRYAIIVARFRYLAIPDPLPHADDLEGLAKTWKLYYNSNLGKGTVDQFIANYKKYNQN